MFIHVGDVLISSVIEFCGRNKSLGGEILAARSPWAPVGRICCFDDVELILCDLLIPCDKNLSVC